MHKLLTIGVVVAMLLPLAASAGHRKPGLWQMTTDVKFTKGGPQIPPDQLAKMQQMGIKIPGMGGGPMTMQLCLTPEQAEKDEHPYLNHGDCQMQNQNWSGHTFTADMVCTGKNDMHGHMQIVAASDMSFTGGSHMEGNNPHLGGDFVMESQISGQWQGADCGSVKPIAPPNQGAMH